MSSDKEGDEMAAQYAAELRHDNALMYAERVMYSPESFHEHEVWLADAVTTLRASVKRWQDDYYRMNSMHEKAETRATTAEARVRVLVEAESVRALRDVGASK